MILAVQDQLATRESQAGPFGVAERFVVPMKPGNGGGGKGPQLEVNAIEATKEGRLVMSLTTPESIQKLPTALPAKAKESPDFRFYARVRQGVPEGHSGVRLRLLQSQWRRSWSRSPGVRGHRGLRGRTRCACGPYGLSLIPPSCCLGLTAGISEVSRFSGMKFLGVSGVYDYALRPSTDSVHAKPC